VTGLDTVSAGAKLSQSRLSDQLELMRDDVDLSSLQLIAAGRPSLDVLAAVTAGSVARTTLGASTLTVILEDRDNRILTSGIFGSDLTLLQRDTSLLKTGIEFSQPVDTRIDGLWFRLVNLRSSGTRLTLTFEDREVAVLRSYPPPGDPSTFKVFAASRMTRAAVMQWLIREAKELDIRIHFGRSIVATGDVFNPVTVTPGPEPQQSKDLQRKPGFPPGEDTVRVKNVIATPTQLSNIQRVLDIGESFGSAMTYKLLVVSVMVITVESNAGKPFPLNGGGLFQQEDVFPRPPGDGPRGDIEADARAFFTAALKLNAEYPSVTYGMLAALIQRPKVFSVTHTDPAGNLYGQYEAEASHTVDEYLGTSISDPGTGATSPFTVPDVPPLDGNKAQFERGQVKIVGGVKSVVRESNWACLQRLASEVGWRVYCVSGTVYIVTDEDLFRSRVRMVADRDTEGVNSVDFEIDTAMAGAQATVNCRIGRWQAPPGSVAQLRNAGPADGRWLVQSVSRDLFTPAGTITLSKPQPTLKGAETPNPIEASGLIIGAKPGQAIRTLGGLDGVVAAARKALGQRGDYFYIRGPTARPMPPTLFQTAAYIALNGRIGVDCSSFATLCYKAAGLPDPNGLNYNGQGFTGTLFDHGTPTATPRPGDLIFWGTDPLAPPAPAHVGVYLGLVAPDAKPQVIEIGGDSGVLQQPYDYYAGPIRGYRTYL
jgi:NlpC/P60 family